MSNNNHFMHTLNNEWAAIAASRSSSKRLKAWTEADDRFVGCNLLDEVVETIIGPDQDRSRRLCWALLAIVKRDELAARTMLRVLRPALMSELVRVVVPARQSTSTSFTNDDGEAEQILITSAVVAIAENAGSTSMWPISDLVHRTHRLVLRSIRADRAWNNQNLIGDEDFDDRWAAEESSVPGPGDQGGNGLDDLVAIVEAIRSMNVISDEEERLILDTRVAGFRIDELSAATGVDHWALYKRRGRAEKRMLAAHAQLESDAVAA